MPDGPEEPPTSFRELADDLTFAARDRNGDQRLTPVEFERGRDVGDRLKDPDAFERLDADGDGLVDRAEWQATRKRGGG